MEKFCHFYDTAGARWGLTDNVLGNIRDESSKMLVYSAYKSSVMLYESGTSSVN